MVKYGTFSIFYIDQLMEDLPNFTVLVCTIMEQWLISNTKLQYSSFAQKVPDILEYFLI